MTPSSYMQTITATVAGYYGLSTEAITGRDRRAEVSHARHMAMRLIHDEAGASTERIGRAFGRDHSTVIYALRHIDGLADAYPRVRAERDELRAIVRGAL